MTCLPSGAGHPGSVRRGRGPNRGPCSSLWSRSMIGRRVNGCARARCRKGSWISSECSSSLATQASPKPSWALSSRSRRSRTGWSTSIRAERGPIGGVEAGQERLVVGGVHRGEHGDHVRGSGRAGRRRHSRQPRRNRGARRAGRRPRCTSPSSSGRIGVVQVAIDAFFQALRVARVPTTGDG